MSKQYMRRFQHIHLAAFESPHSPPLCDSSSTVVVVPSEATFDESGGKKTLVTCPRCKKKSESMSRKLANRKRNPTRSRHTEFAESLWHEDPEDENSLVRKIVSASGRLEAQLVVNYRPYSNRWQVSVTTHDDTKNRGIIEILDLGDGVIQGVHVKEAATAAEQCFYNFIQDVASLDKIFRSVRG